MENTKDSHLFALCKEVSKLAKSILSHIEKRHKENEFTHVENTPRVFCRLFLIRKWTLTSAYLGNYAAKIRKKLGLPRLDGLV
jgi:hypothetical protein